MCIISSNNFNDIVQNFIVPETALVFSTYNFSFILFPIYNKNIDINNRPTDTIRALKNEFSMNAFRLLLAMIQANPAKKYYKVISLFSSRTVTA